MGRIGWRHPLIPGFAPKVELLQKRKNALLEAGRATRKRKTRRKGFVARTQGNPILDEFAPSNSLLCAGRYLSHVDGLRCLRVTLGASVNFVGIKIEFALQSL